MSLDDFLDTEILYSPVYWLLAGGAELALLIGFKAQGLWNAGAGMPFFSKVVTLVAIPIVAYFIVMFMSKR